MTALLTGVIGPHAALLVARNVLAWRGKWVILVGGALEPVLYLVAMGLGVGGLVGAVPGPGGEPIPYAVFVTPALLASSAMNGTLFESFNVYFKLKELRLYDAVLTTPMEPRDVAIGEIAWALLRAGLYGAAFLIVAALLGLVPSAWGVLALPASLLVGFAFGGIFVAATTFIRSWKDFDLLNLAVIPLFLGSATFYPLEVYPRPLQLLAHLSPLYHGVVLTRSLTLGVLSPTLLVNIAVLAALGVIGLRVASRRIGTLLLR